ncbi:MAG: DNA repair protein RadC [Bacteroidales bacterium]|nr:DNA repair protein RadC [Bacteroidales bacterium]MCD8395150.1 DNA repair protein RadC [Bacteroidales bacterium]
MIDTPLNRIQDLSEDDRPREKALRLGIQSLTNAELLAIIFGGGVPGKSVIQLSQEILRDHDNRLSRIARLSIHELTSKYRGIGPAKAVSLAAALELGLRCQSDFASPLPQIYGSETVYDMMRPHMCRLNYEEFWVFHLNHANRLIARECISSGGTASTLVDVKLLMKKAVDKLATGIILAHNHPSGNLQPSGADRQLTTKISKACDILDIRLLDHVIIAANDYYSFRDHGDL